MDAEDLGYRVFETGNGACVVADSFIKRRGKGESLALVKAYRERIIKTSGEGFPRKHLKSGGNSDVYSCGDGMVVKEAVHSQSSFFAFERMLKIEKICQENDIGFSVPQHYGVLFDQNLQRQYTLMSRVNTGGYTVEDYTQNFVEGIENLDELKTEIRAAYEEDSRKLNETLTSLGESELITDLHEGNVVVDLETPSNGRSFSLWLIDQ